MVQNIFPHAHRLADLRLGLHVHQEGQHNSSQSNVEMHHRQEITIRLHVDHHVVISKNQQKYLDAVNKAHVYEKH